LYLGNKQNVVTGMDCHFSVWGVLAFLSLSLLVSVTLNIVHCMKKKQAMMAITQKIIQFMAISIKIF
uniref:Uncharacterized protein n=1 Tax=Junco hyemalis TaxID=40217 RepID=A0A8C5JRJ6_JUNHY